MQSKQGRYCDAAIRTATARKQSGIEREGWVLCCGPNERDGTLLNVWQECILLCLVEAVNLIQEEDGASACEALRTGRSLNALPNLRNTTRYGGETLENTAGGMLLHHGSK